MRFGQQFLRAGQSCREARQWYEVVTAVLRAERCSDFFATFARTIIFLDIIVCLLVSYCRTIYFTGDNYE